MSVINIFFFLLFMTANLHAGPSRFSCDYYEELEAEFSCGPKGYFRKFGIPLCHRYLSAEPKLSPNLIIWLQEVRLCLQLTLESDLSRVSGCDELREAALASHEGCYKSTGYCELFLREKLTVMKLTASRILNRDVLRLARKLPGLCR